MNHADGIILPHEVEARRVALCFASSAVMDDYTGKPWRLDMAGADLSLLNSGRAPLLSDHYQAVDGMLGVVESAWIDGEQAMAVARFAATPRALEAWTLVRDGFLQNVSMGFICEEPRQYDAEASEICRRWRPYEISLVAVPRNWKAQVILCAPEKQVEAVAKSAEERRQAELHEAIRTSNA